jgi:hypothetical protein
LQPKSAAAVTICASQNEIEWALHKAIARCSESVDDEQIGNADINEDTTTRASSGSHLRRRTTTLPGGHCVKSVVCNAYDPPLMQSKSAVPFNKSGAALAAAPDRVPRRLR